MKIAEFVDLFLFDIKQIDPEKHSYWTGVRNERILDNITTLLDNRYNVKVRMPLLKTVNADEVDIKGVIEFLKPYKDYKNFKGVDLLPYHKLGVNKYKQLDMTYEIQEEVALSDEDLDRIKGYFDEAGFSVTVMKHSGDLRCA